MKKLFCTLKSRIGIYFKEGFNVSKGTLLAKINDADLQAQLKKLNFQLKLAKKKIDSMDYCKFKG